MSDNQLLLAALDYAKKGYSVFPLQQKGKKPLTSNGFKDASTNPEQIRRWWEQWPNANIGLPTGSKNGLFVVDVDGDIPDDFPDFNIGPTVKTGKGHHYYVEQPENTDIRSRTRINGFEIDVRGEGGYVVAPPSIHETGRNYEHCSEFEVNECTSSILEFISQKSQNSKETERKPIGHPDLMTDDVETLISALQAIPNDLEYDDWIRILAAYKAAVGGDEAYYPVVEEWSLEWPDNTTEIVWQKWNSITHAEASARTIFYEATKRGWVNPKPEWAKDLNKDHFVAPAGKDTYVFREVTDPVFEGRRVLQCHSFPGFKKLHDNKPTFIQKGKKQQYVGKGTAWVTHLMRRTYEKGLAFFPDKDAPEGYYNLWQGWGVKPEKGSWELMKYHLLHVVCGGGQEAYDYLIGWMAYAVQHPDRQGEVAVVIHGAKGVGKNTIGHYFHKIFGQHYLYISQGHHLTGHFNAHLRDAVFLIVDEAFFAGDKKAEGVLKSIITEEILPVEKKGQDLITCRNYMHIMMFSNLDWVIRATGKDERRYFVLCIPEERKQDQDYFTALYAELNDGGPAAMLFDLLNYDLSKFNLRSIPQTQALVEQKLRSLDPAAKWLYDCLCNGQIGGWDWEDDRFYVVTQKVHEYYVQHHKDHSYDGKPLADAVWSKTIRSVLKKDGQSLIKGVKVTHNGTRLPHTSFPPLSEARNAFEQYLNGEIEWPEMDNEEINLDDLLD